MWRLCQNPKPPTFTFFARKFLDVPHSTPLLVSHTTHSLSPKVFPNREEKEEEEEDTRENETTGFGGNKTRRERDAMTGAL